MFQRSCPSAHKYITQTDVEDFEEEEIQRRSRSQKKKKSSRMVDFFEIFERKSTKVSRFRKQPKGGTQVNTEPILQLLIESSGLALSICHCLGQSSSKDLACVAPVLRVSVSVIMPYLKTLLPPLICIVGGRDGLKVQNDVHAFDQLTSSWESLKPMASARNGCGAVVCRDKLYAVGGRNELGKVSAEVQLYDETQKQWIFLANMQMEREKFACVEIRGGIYVTGGWGGKARELKLTEHFDPDRGKWTSLAPMPTARSSCGAAAINSCMYVAGGLSGRDEALAVLEVYNPETNTWKSMPPMPTPRFDCGVAAQGGRLIVAGGRSTTNNLGEVLDVVECFDPHKGTWESLPPLVAPRFGCGAASVGDKVFVFGGWDDVGAVSRVEALELGPEKISTWNSKLPVMPTVRGGCAVTVLSR